jgi:hypothetical protein
MQKTLIDKFDNYIATEKNNGFINVFIKAIKEINKNNATF